MREPVVFPRGYELQTGRLCAFLINVACDMGQQWVRQNSPAAADFGWTPNDTCAITNRAYSVAQFEFGDIIWSRFRYLGAWHTEPFGFIARDLVNAEAAQRYLVFRGSQTRADFGMDAECQLAAYSAPTSNPPFGLKIETGFQQVFAGLEGTLSGQLEALSGTPITVTGHSLGATLATQAVPLAVSRRLTVQHYNQASPSVGNVAFASYYSALRVPTFRLVNTADEVLRPPAAEAHVPLGKQASFSAALDTQARKHSPCCYAYALFNPDNPRSIRCQCAN